MLRVPIYRIEPGMVLARPVPYPNDPYRFLLQRDREIPMSAVAQLEKFGILDVWVRHRSLEFLEDVIDEGLGQRQREVYWQVRRNFEMIMTDASFGLDVSQFQSVISNLFDFLKQSSCGNILLDKLDAFDCYLMSHSTNVCYLAMLLGMKLERYLIDERKSKTPQEAKKLKELGLGCLLHDVGKMKVPDKILNKPGRFTPEERKIMELHPVHGYEMVKGRISPMAAQIVLNHHQQYCGGGYPQRVDVATGEPLPTMQGKQIPVLCRLVTMCDVYDAATSKRVYHNAKPAVQVLHEMRTFCRGFFDPVIEHAFYQIIPPFPIGQIVTLSNRIEAVVVDFNPDQPARPKVQCLRSPSGETFTNPSLEEVDLAIFTDIEIVEVEGLDVRPYLSTQYGLELAR